VPVVDPIDNDLDNLLRQTLPKSALGKAVT
jgi:hypothetical protein